MGSDPADQILIDRGFLLVGEGSLSDRVREGVNAIQTRRLRLEYQSRDPAPASEAQPAPQRAADTTRPTVIVPIIRLATRDGLQHLHDVSVAVEVALEPLSMQLVARELSSSAFAYVPWVQLEQQFAAVEPDRALFRGPIRIRGGKCVPILHVNSDSLVSWSERGWVALLADLLALYGFSALPEAASWLSPTNWAGDTFHTFNSSFVELPMARSRRRRAVKQLEDALLYEPKDDVPIPDAREALRPLVDLIELPDVDYKAFYTGDNPLGLAIELAPDRTDFMAVSVSRNSETLHDRAVTAVHNAVSTEIGRVAGDKLREFRRELTRMEDGLADGIRKLINDRAQLNESFLAAMQFCEALAHGLPKPPADGAGRDVNELERQTVARRGQWVSEEEALWQDGNRIPSQLTVAISSGIIAVGCALAGFVAGEALVRWRGVSEGWAYVVTTVATALGAIVYWRSRESAVRAYFDRWRAFEESIRSTMSSVARVLAEIANRRLRSMKTAALPGLERSLRAVRVRLQTGGRG